MPEDIENAPAVTDPDLLTKALAGPNWKCRYCESAQRRLDGLCANCGSNQEDSTDRRKLVQPDPFKAVEETPYRKAAERPYYPPDEPEAVPSSFTLPPFRRRPNWNAYVVGAVLTGIVCLLVFAFWPRTVHTSVVSVHWDQTILVERRRVLHQNGFYESRPEDAFNVRDLGPRYHHTDQVLDHYETVHYVDHEQCGKKCVTTPPTCYTTRKDCKSNKNGFATCTGGDKVCSGGGTSCTPTYCDVPKTREKPVYVDVPRYHNYYEWDVWRWTPERNVGVYGDSVDTRWPNASELKLCDPCLNGEQERTGPAKGVYTVNFDKENLKYSPRSETDFHRFAKGSNWTVKVDRMGVIHDVLPR